MGKPKIRFKGYADDWEQRKFSELYVRSSEKNDGSIGMDKNITVATMQFKEDVQVSTAEYLKTYYTFNLGDIAFEGHQSKEFRYGRFVENDIGNGIVSHIFAVFRPIQEYDLYFWKYAINNETLMQRILGRSTKASTMMHDLVANDFLNETFLVPSIDEQKQIGSLFNKLDHLITLHQWKHYRIKKIINSAWEQRKLGDLGTIQTCKRIFKDQTSESGEIPFYKNGTIGLKADAFISREIFEEYKLLYPYPEKGDILISAVGSVGRTAEYTGEDEYFQDSNVVWLKTDNSIDKKYLKVFYQVIKWLIEGSTVKHLYNDNILKSEIVFPYSLDEQRKIGEYFDSLDHLITLHQQKYKSLKKLKKFMVKNMFLQVKCKNTEKDR